MILVLAALGLSGAFFVSMLANFSVWQGWWQSVFAVLLRLYQLSPATAGGWLNDLLTVIAIASILFGNLLALLQSNLKRLLGYSSIAHFGYLLVALIASKGLAVEAIGVYLATYVLTSLGAFGVVTLMSTPYSGRDADALYEYRGLFWRRPYLTAVLTVAGFSLQDTIVVFKPNSVDAVIWIDTLCLSKSLRCAERDSIITVNLAGHPVDGGDGRGGARDRCGRDHAHFQL